MIMIIYKLFICYTIILVEFISILFNYGIFSAKLINLILFFKNDSIL